MRFMNIPAGSFDMGESNGLPDALLESLCDPSRPDPMRRYPHGDFDERPVHLVTIGKSFSMSATQVANAQYE
jgi:formylglycine-generating enzyme required for sulfatase activity